MDVIGAVDVLVKYKSTRTIKPSSSRSIEYLREPELCIYIYIILLYVCTKIQIIIEEVLNPSNYSGKGVRPAIYIVNGNPTRGAAIVLNAVRTRTYYPQSRSRKSVSIILSTHYIDV